jgi:signal transduction histidine kinase
VEHRVLIYAPTGKDGRLIGQVLTRAGIECFVCTHFSEVAGELVRGAGALLLANEALSAAFLNSVRPFLDSQHTWSDLPVLVLSLRGASSQELSQQYQLLGNVTLLERPLQGVTIVSAATSALRARKRQYAMRDVDRRKDEFLAMLAHELRNPLAPISAASDLLKIPDLDRTRIHKTSEIISRQVKHMTGLIDDLLDVSRVSRGLVKLEQKVVDLRQVLNHAVEQVRPLIESRKHRLTIQTPHEPAYVNGDLKRLIQIVANLLNNAAKYTLPSGDLRLALDVDATSVTIAVDDNGIGMEAHLLAHVFDMFSQAQRSSDRSQGGLGIGLSIVKSLVSLHGGEVLACSAGVGKGSRFTVKLPRALRSDASAPLAASPIAALPENRQRILVVDDNVDAANLLGMFLDLAGYQTTVVYSAQAALDHVQLEVPEVFLLDIGLPDMDGNELARRLRAQPRTSSSQLFAITGYGQQADRQKTSAAGFDRHFVKPVEMEKLLGVLSALH